MRRQARISGGGALVERSASALQVWLWLLIFIFQNEFRISRSIQPGYLDFDNLPETNFTCTGKVIGGYYADLETSCQMFHVCTVGQQDEPMDIKFLCLNGTVFDQETRVCERVDEVDCTKSEKFYSLNLELYGSTAPPIIQPEQSKPHTESLEHEINKEESDENNDPSLDATVKPTHGSSTSHLSDTIDTTEEPTQDTSHDSQKIKNESHPTYSPPVEQITQNLEPIEENHEIEEEDNENTEYEYEYISVTSSTTSSPATTITPVTTTVHITSPEPPRLQTATTQSTTLSVPVTSPAAPISQPSPIPATATVQSIDPALLTPQEFIYHNRQPGAEAISFQRQGFRPADGVYITHAPPQQYDHFQYESSRTAPRPIVSRPAPFSPRSPPMPFRATTFDPRDQLSRPGPSSQPSERHETAIKHRQPYPSLSALPAQRPLPFDPFYFDRKRSDDTGSNVGPTLTARSAIPSTISERPPPKPKSPPRVIVTASASVSDSNGKRLNYTVGNVVSAVKPIVQINYDDYKESDLIFDPFFLDVPKLQKRRKTRANGRNIVTAAAITTPASDILPVTTEHSTTPTLTTAVTVIPKRTTTVTTTTAWNPNDYVDDNYEPHAYLPPVPPIAYILPFEKNKNSQDRQSHNNYVDAKINQNEMEKVRRLEHSKPLLSVARTHVSSSQSPVAPSTVKLR